jgi:hypothetical protein
MFVIFRVNVTVYYNFKFPHLSHPMFFQKLEK